MNEALPQSTPAPQPGLALVPELPPPTPVNGSAPFDQSTEGGTIVTSNTKLATTYMTFGYRLRRYDPFYWIDHYKLEDVQKFGLAKAPYKSHCYFNLVPRSAADIQSAKGIGAAFSREDGQERLLSFLSGLPNLTPQEKNQLLYLCSVVIAQGCREAQERREHLIKTIKEMPARAKWVRVWNGTRFVTFGYNASIETRTQLLAKL